MLASSSAPSTLETTTTRRDYASEALHTSAGAPFASGEAAVADERVRHPLLTAVQFIRTHANAQLRDEQGDKCEAAATPAEDEAEAETEAEPVDIGARAAAAFCNDGELGAEMVENVAELEPSSPAAGDSNGPVDASAE